MLTMPKMLPRSRVSLMKPTSSLACSGNCWAIDCGDGGLPFRVPQHQPEDREHPDHQREQREQQLPGDQDGALAGPQLAPGRRRTCPSEVFRACWMAALTDSVRLRIASDSTRSLPCGIRIACGGRSLRPIARDQSDLTRSEGFRTIGRQARRPSARDSTSGDAAADRPWRLP